MAEFDDRRDAQTVRAWFTNLSHLIRAALSFNYRGDLTDFVADGRGAMSADGTSFAKLRWSTPLSDHREFGSSRLTNEGELACASGGYSYVRFDLDAIECNR